MKFVIRGTKVNKKGKEKYLYLQEPEAGVYGKYTMGLLSTAKVFQSQYHAKVFVARELQGGYLVGKPFYKVIEIYSMSDEEYDRLCNA